MDGEQVRYCSWMFVERAALTIFLRVQRFPRIEAEGSATALGSAAQVSSAPDQGRLMILADRTHRQSLSPLPILIWCLSRKHLNVYSSITIAFSPRWPSRLVYGVGRERYTKAIGSLLNSLVWTASCFGM